MTSGTVSRSGLGTDTSFLSWGMLWLIIATVGAAAFFWEGIRDLLTVWQLPEYSHGPLIPILSGLLFLRQLKTMPPQPGPSKKLWLGVVVLLLAVTMGALGKLIDIDDIVAYGLIVWVGAVLLICFGWDQGKEFWPPVLHLVFMLPLPGALYYGLSTYLQGVSSELGVYFVQMMQIPVYLEGNIIDLGVYKLHVAEACSGLRYLFPILSFSYIFAVLYQGPMWHKALLLLDQGDNDAVLALYDEQVRSEKTDDYRDFSNASSLLMRLELEGVSVGDRWEELAALAETRTDDGCLIFADLHY
ncbi:MAG: archaeosortase/exosortase family protein, partial [Rhodobacteraceae bacterium]|nr:archaeosortase/exosortase family protein [Paracoccaceae bacterium]